MFIEFLSNLLINLGIQRLRTKVTCVGWCVCVCVFHEVKFLLFCKNILRKTWENVFSSVKCVFPV